MRAELVTTTLAKLRGRKNDALKIECDGRELPLFTHKDCEFDVGGKKYYFQNNQSFGNKKNGKAIVYLFSD